MKELIEEWFRRAILLEVGKELLIECESRQEQTMIKKMLLELRKSYRLDPVESSKLTIQGLRKDRKFWIVIKKRSTSLLVGFIRDQNGGVEKVILEESSEHSRQIKLMLSDNYSIPEIAETLNLTEEIVVELMKNISPSL